MEGEAIPAAMFRAAEQISDMIALFDSGLNLLWMNAFGLNTLGYRLEDIVGKAGLDYVHPDDLDRVALSVVRTIDPSIDLPLKPAPARLLMASGEYVSMDINGGGYLDEDGGAILLVCRVNAEADLHDQLMDLLTHEAPSERAFALVPAFPQWRQPLLWHAVFYLDDDGHPAAAGSPELLGLGGLDEPTAPWASIAEAGERGFAEVKDLEPSYRARAEALGLIRFGAQPVWDALHGQNAIAVYAQHQGSPHPGDPKVLPASLYVIESTARILGLVLGWRSQVVRLRRAAATDPLTGLANRAGFDAAWQRYAQTAPDVLPLAVLSIDLDGFKEVNDTYGHPTGDELLVEVAARLRHAVRSTDVVARLGGDEFVVIAPALDHAEDSQLAERIVTSMAEPFKLRDHEIQIGASVGVAGITTGAASLDRLLERADLALYDAKAGGRGRWQIHDASG